MSIIYDEKKRLYGIKGKVKLPNGKYRNYNRKPQYKRKKDAIQAESDLRFELTSVKENITLDELVKLYHSKAVILGKKETTLYNQEQIYENHIKERFGNVYLEDITTHDIERWQIDLVQSNKYTERSINTFTATMKLYINYAFRNDIIKSNPVSRIRMYHDKEKPNEENSNFWELSEFQQFIQTVDNEFYNLLFTFLFYTGLRIGELEALQWSDFKDGQIGISKSRNNLGKITSPKNKNSYRTINLPRPLSERLEKRYKDQKQIDGFSSDFYIFGSYSPSNATTVREWLNRYIQVAGVKKITLHGFRHSHASMLIKMGVDDSLIAKRLGHTVSVLRSTYAHIYSSSKDDMIAKLEKTM